MKMQTDKRITLATFKSFVRHNLYDLHVNVVREFDSSIDGCAWRNTGFSPANAAETVWQNNLGISGIWLVGGSGRSGDSFRAYDENGWKGIAVYNCCGSFIVAVKAADAAA